MNLQHYRLPLILGSLALLLVQATVAQVPPSAQSIVNYEGLLAAAASGDATRIRQLAREKVEIDVRDSRQRTPLHIAAYSGQHDAMRALVAAGADPNAMEGDDYDIVTIAAVANDLPTLRVALELGASPSNVTSPYRGTALIAAAHLGHHEVVRTLIEAGAPLDHVNNLGWTAVIESIVLGDGGDRHVATLAALIAGGADINLPDRNGRTPLALARRMGYREMAALLESAGGR
ncbi:MAG: ankyrin repeat domain-containing protein [Sedimenticola sp.]|nr:ankyrin repeat domain-containing protein [Sedimenticola sp.]